MNNKVWEAWAIQQNTLVEFMSDVKFLCLTTIIKAYCSVGVYVWIAICKIEYRHIIFTFAHGIVLQMALHIYVFINNVEWEVSLKYKG